MFKNKFKPAHELRRKISIITVCALLVTVLCGSALLGGCKKTPALSDDVNSLVSGISGDKNGATDDNNSATNENSGGTANTGSQTNENKEPNNVTGDNNNNNTTSTPESESKAPESAATDDKASNPQQQFKYYIQKLDEYGKTVRQTDYYEEKVQKSALDEPFNAEKRHATKLVVVILHQYSHPNNSTGYINDTGWTINDFKAIGATNVQSSVTGVSGNTNETVYLDFDGATYEQVLKYGKELEKYSCVKQVEFDIKVVPA
mgnify:CR=1 FL=1